MRALDIIFAGSGEFGLATLGALLDSPHRIIHVYSQPDRPAGRGRRLTPTAVAEFALGHGLPLTRTGDVNAERLPAADLLIVIAFGQKIAPHIVNHPRLGSVNLHASLLPRYRGAAPINWAILRGETVTGNSIIRVAARMDAGAVLGQSTLAIDPLETAGELHDRLAEAGAPLMLQVVQELADGSAEERPQNDAEATVAPKLKRELARIDWMRGARDIANQIRGLHPWPGCHVRQLDGSGAEINRLTLVRARPVAAASRSAGGMAPGTIAEGLSIAAGDGGCVDIVELQPEGKRPMSLQAYRNGHPWEAGMRLESI